MMRHTPDAAVVALEAAPISRVATGRNHSLFAPDVEMRRTEIAAAVAGKRVLCVGAAGSIGSSTTALLVDLEPASLHLVDQNENGLVELVRSFRSRRSSISVRNFRTLPLDYGSPVMRQLLQSEPPYDLVLNFAAIKHVRSEKDVFSVLQMFDTNLLKQARFLAWLAESHFAGRYFSVSTDKAANPTSMMGATKRIMEHVMFAAETAPATAAAVSSARFANVAFSNGSLLESFELRLKRGEPLAAPRDTKRYFVSLEESGQICLIASTIAPHGSIVIPRLDPREHLIALQDVAERLLARHGYEAEIYHNEETARTRVMVDRARGRWPLLLTPLDTSGEKSYEEFVGEGEVAIEIGLPNLLAVTYRSAPKNSISRLIAEIAKLISGESGGPKLDKNELKAAIARVEPGFLDAHRETGRNLDERM